MGIEGLNIDEINSKVAQYWSVSVTEETRSTQLDLRANFNPGEVLIAEFQSAGRGRLDRKFEVPAGKGLLFSFTLKIDREFGWIPLITGLAVAQAINEYLNKELVFLKWPNDLLIGEDKLGGILCEQVGDELVIGVGINIFQSKSELPTLTATSLSMHGQVDRTQLMILILNSIGGAFSKINLNAELDELKQLYQERCVTLGKKIAAILPHGESIEDVAIGISNDGSLLLKSREITVADIVHLR